MADTPTTPTVRIVPGAPPPAPLTKSQKKKKVKTAKKTPEHDDVVLPDAASAALTEKAPTEIDVKEGSVAPELIAQPEGQAPQTPVEDPSLKVTPIVDMLNKRLKQIHKKIVSTGARVARTSIPCTMHAPDASSSYSPCETSQGMILISSMSPTVKDRAVLLFAA